MPYETENSGALPPDYATPTAPDNNFSTAPLGAVRSTLRDTIEMADAHRAAVEMAENQLRGPETRETLIHGNEIGLGYIRSAVDRTTVYERGPGRITFREWDQEDDLPWKEPKQEILGSTKSKYGQTILRGERTKKKK